MHDESLDKKIQPFFTRLSEFPQLYLAGGTALALQIGHRISADVDCFSSTPLSSELLGRVENVFSDRTITPSVNNSDELTVFVDGAKVTFLYYPFPVMLALVDYRGVKMLSIPELAATKAYTIGRRGSYKDYIDLYYIVFEQHTMLKDIVALAQKKFGSAFNARLFLEQLVYVDDVKDTKIIFLKKAVAKQSIQVFFEKSIREMSW